MQTFKLLAIRPLINCDKQYSKNLQLGEIYSFYNDYEFLSENDEKVTGVIETSFIKYTNSVLEDLYNITTANGTKHNINISAIVGKNGSGKSALTELFFLAIYLLSINRNILYPNLESIPRSNEKLNRKLKIIKDKNLKIDHEENIRDLERVLANDPDFEDLKSYFKDYFKIESKNKKKIKNYEDKINALIAKKDEIINIQKKLFVEIYYQISNTIFKITIKGIQEENDHQCNVSVISSNLIETDSDIKSMIRNLKIDNILDKSIDIFEYFFYTVSINYSQYSLNSNFLGDWINSLFHKNDGYKTPIVINPMRNDGNYDINKEMIFAKYRLLSNILIQQKNYKIKDKPISISDNLNVSFIRFFLNKNKIFNQSKKQKEEIDVKRDKNLVDDIVTKFLDLENITLIKNSNSDFFDIISNYIVDKVDKISETYVGYEDNYHPTDTIINEKLVERLFEDGSHITFKLHQAINFLQNNMYSPNSKKLFDLHEDYIDFSLDQLIEWMGNPEPQDIIKNLPPPIFNFEIFLSNENEKEVNFNTLSSGEQQLIHSIQSVIYHINNLESVYSSSIDRVSYKHINIIYDEIELYFHPEYQKRFIKELLQSLEKLYVSKIEGINILFSSHSPFILSDITSSNILRLNKGKIQINKSTEQTFGANINDILANDFFLTNGFMGEFVKDKINSVIDFITEDKNPNNIWTINTAKEFIELIGEPLIRTELRELFLRSFYIEEKVDIKQLEQEIERLQNIIKLKK